jgi:acetoin utilization deacetylase AcuC-like enzyme
VRTLKVTHSPQSLRYPERSIDSADRVKRAWQVAKELGLEHLHCAGGPIHSDFAAVHTEEYLAGLEALSKTAGAFLDPELYLDREMWLAALASGALTVAATRTALREPVDVLVLSRPGSHHAGPDFALGHCVVNNLAVAAAFALKDREKDIERVAILDLDAHHGNGTQDIFYDDPRVLTVSLHQYPFFPGTGAATELGGAGAPGSTLNLPLPAGCRGPLYLERLEEALAAVKRFAPGLLLVEAGVDAHAEDWTSDLALKDADFYAVGARVQALAAELDCPLVLEFGGGYTAGAVQGGLSGFLCGLLGRELATRREGIEHVTLGQARGGTVADLAAGLAGLRLHGLTLAETFPYAARFGAFLRADHPDWFATFASSPAAQLPLAQAVDYAFLKNAEATEDDLEVDRALARYLSQAPAYVRQELANTLAWYAGEVEAGSTP